MDDTVGNSCLEFAAKFCNELEKTKNCIFSPLLVAEIPIITNALSSTFPFGLKYDVKIGSENNVPLFPSILPPKLKLIKGVTFKRSSKVYLSIKHYKLGRKQKRDAKDIFNVKIKNIDFSQNASAADIINAGMEKKTKGKIKGFLKCNDFNGDTSIVLVNGLYFKGLWHMKFDPDYTQETIFYLNNNETVNVFLMYRKEKYNYKDSSELAAQLLLLPFKSKETYMLVVLPKRVTELNRVLHKLAEGYDLMAEVGEMSNCEVDVRIPRFRIESEININEALRKLGVPTIFDKAVQKVLIHVNEEGTEPKPERMTCGFIPRWKPKPIEFTADRPHLIIIIYENIPIVWVTFRGRFE